MTKPDALMFYSPGCAYCPQVHAVLEKLLKEGELGKFEAINIAEDTAQAEALGVRSVPWTRIGDLELEGQYSEKEIRHWLSLVLSGKAKEVFLLDCLENGRLNKAEQLLKRVPDMIHVLIKYLPDMEQSINVRLGISALLEGLQGTEQLQSMVDDLGKLVTSNEQQVRADACHYLGLTGHPDAKPYLEKALQDKNDEVREIAQESLEEIG